MLFLITMIKDSKRHLLLKFPMGTRKYFSEKIIDNLGTHAQKGSPAQISSVTAQVAWLGNWFIC
jgi:hypothetical protein